VVNAKVECDLYFNSSDALIGTTKELLAGAVLDLHDKSGVMEKLIDDGWMFIEMTQGPQYLAQKLWRLERAVQILSTIAPTIRPASLVVLMNGEEKEARQAIDLINVPHNSLIF
jgi:hypothetical protein